MEPPEYDLPAEAIAQTPAEPRDSARLLDATSPTGSLADRVVRDLPEMVGPGDVVVVNDSKVIPARLILQKPTGGQAEVMLLEPLPRRPHRHQEQDLDQAEWLALVRPGRRLPPGTRLSPPTASPPTASPPTASPPTVFPPAPGPPTASPPGEPAGPARAVVEVGARRPDGRREIRFLADPDETIRTCGRMALPPYIHTSLPDPDRYQTVYANQPGSVAAPTAGLHLTDDLLARVRGAGAEVHTVDLAVGLATFRPLPDGPIEAHEMHTERYHVPEKTWAACAQADRVIAIGTTTVRALESAASTGRMEGESDLFIRPGFRFGVVDVLMTNFHMPRSTLLLLLEAFMGPRWRDVYDHALGHGYRFLSFGDAMIAARA